MGNNLSFGYYDFCVKNTPYPDFERSPLYRYAYFLDNKEDILYRTGYEVDKDCSNPIFHKAYTRAILDRYPESKNDNRENFIYITSLPRELLKNCYFQRELNKYYNKDIIDWSLKYKSVKNCYS